MAKSKRSRAHPIVCESPAIDPNWRAQSALSDIERAEEHKKDKKLMGQVKKMAREKASCLDKIAKK